MPSMRVAVVDVGSNTARLLVADVDDEVEAVREEKTFLGLAADLVQQGKISGTKLELAGRTARSYRRIADKLDAEALEVVVTAPGRQGGSGRALVAELERATRSPVRVLSAGEEGRLAFAGALSRAPELEGVAAVCDVGGGSTEVAVGTRTTGATWVGSADVGSLRLTHTHLSEAKPSAEEIAAAREAARDAYAGFAPPAADEAIAVGGSARAAAKIVGRRLGPEELDAVAVLVAARGHERIAETFGLDLARAETLLAGAVLLGEASRRIGLPFRLGRGGLRDGAALSLAARAQEAAA
jgi:exopolyphosphatase/guanosine-5'-triphosphate,3'-diphosphate pyrophosphatase